MQLINFGTNKDENIKNLNKITKFIGTDYFSNLSEDFFSFKSYNESYDDFDGELKKNALDIFEKLNLTYPNI